MVRVFFWIYLAVAAAATCWAWAVDIALRNDPGDHSLPNMVLIFLSYPTGYLVGPLLRVIPEHLYERHFWLTPLELTIGVASQLAVVFGLVKLEDRFFRRIELSRHGDGSQV